MDEWEQRRIVQRATRGNLEAISWLYDRHHQAIFRFILARVGHRQTAEDLTGEVFVRMVDALPGYRVGQTPFHAWLYRIARNLLIDHYRREERPLMPPDIPPDPRTIAEDRLTIERVYQALDSLNETQRQVIMLRFLAGMPLKEVAETLDTTIAAVKAHQHRGLYALRGLLKRQGGEA